MERGRQHTKWPRSLFGMAHGRAHCGRFLTARAMGLGSCLPFKCSEHRAQARRTKFWYRVPKRAPRWVPQLRVVRAPGTGYLRTTCDREQSFHADHLSLASSPTTKQKEPQTRLGRYLSHHPTPTGRPLFMTSEVLLLVNVFLGEDWDP